MFQNNNQVFGNSPQQSKVNNIGPEGTNMISETLKSNSTLTSLNLSSEQTEGTSQTINLLRESMQTDNPITPGGLRVLCQSLLINATLKKLFLRMNTYRGVCGFSVFHAKEKFFLKYLL